MFDSIVSGHDRDTRPPQAGPAAVSLLRDTLKVLLTGRVEDHRLANVIDTNVLSCSVMGPMAPAFEFARRSIAVEKNGKRPNIIIKSVEVATRAARGASSRP